MSSSSTALGSQACSSRRTINSPIRAVERQWIRRTSSPGRYSRTRTSSEPIRLVFSVVASDAEPRPEAARCASSGCTWGSASTSAVPGSTRWLRASPRESVTLRRSGPRTWRPRQAMVSRCSIRCWPEPTGRLASAGPSTASG
ncbi:MAG: hypothetical protein QM804_08340 [Propionicimonas sp.]